jgi:hypothetical protein
MYKPPYGFPSNAFAGARVEHVSFSANTIHIAFDKDVSLTIDSGFEYRGADGAQIEQGEPPVTDSRLMSLIDLAVAKSSVDVNGNIELHFDDERVLRVLNDRVNYECYHVQVADKTWHV